ncbi:RNA 3'-terminal phosphate cyclase [Suillus bovinus]|uniref:RNA 3'-terminal phosphate cyclase n=1 Tax=Suillus bovinus TaxID=48563 RepID=UPI001B864BCA|nr:RNA 3'-terminal phosphate cyclase [Suillus bovinus]KAG2157580.1 RNA 3'-terminal phosphate cyclase [Suillus bovinus]
MTSTILHIDGSFCEGGGQILRNAVALSALLSKPISIQNVRHNRRPPGLRKQHEAGINLAAAICSAETDGVHLSSTSVTFKPRKIRLPKTLTADPGTAGSTTLLLQVSLPCLLFSPSPTPPSQLTLRGGTNASQAPQIDYTQHVFLPFMKRHFGLDIALKIIQRGYFPKGGGTVFCSVPSLTEALPPVTLTERGPVRLIRGEARVGGLPFFLAERMKNAARATLLAGGVSPTIVRINAVRETEQETVGSGGGILLLAETDNGCMIAGSSVSTRGRDPEEIGKEAAEELLRNLRHDGCVDEYLQDQIIIFIALAKGRSTVKTGPLTDHTRTAIKIAEQMTGATFHLQEDPSGFVIISCDGIGYTPSL